MQPGKTPGGCFAKSDDFHPERRGGKITPRKENIPSQYQTLLDWYQDKFVGKRKSLKESDPILELRGLGKEIWVGEDADEYVSRLRGGWE